MHCERHCIAGAIHLTHLKRHSELCEELQRAGAREQPRQLLGHVHAAKCVRQAGESGQALQSDCSAGGCCTRPALLPAQS
jgi:hypothetical protein